MNGAYNVLIAEDEIGHAIPLRNYLEDHGFKPTLVKDVVGLRDNVEDTDILIVDVRLPWQYGERIQDLNGITAVAEFLNENKLGPMIPLIFISILAASDKVCQEKLQEVQMPQDRYCWLQKPFEMELLEDKIRDQLSNIRP